MAAKPAGKSKAKTKTKSRPKPAPKAKAVPAAEGKLKAGMKAPAFRLPKDGGGEVSLAEFKGRKLVLYFYPKADTPGCTREAIDFSRLSGAFAKTGTEVLGVSADPVKAQDKFKTKHNLKIALGSDETHAMLEALGDDLRFVLITSSARVEAAADAAAEGVTVTPSTHAKCQRCWHWRAEVGSDATHPGLCGRCLSNLFGAGEPRRFA